MPRVSPLFAIVGLTATGKTGLAWSLAEAITKTPELGFEHLDVISVDSRQVYQGLEIVSGADLPATAQRQHDDRFPFPYVTENNLRLHGVSILPATRAWSAAEFQQFAQQVIAAARATAGLPVCVGGTGLYYDVLSGAVPLDAAQPNEEIRQQAEQLSVEELQLWVQHTAPQLWQALNLSDRGNPRRLVRALERREAKQTLVQSSPLAPALTIGLTAPLEVVTQNIVARVKERLAGGAIAEVERLLAGLTAASPALTATGVKEIAAYLRDECTATELEQRWITRERQYAKRQLTWWKGRSDVVWFDVSESNWKKTALDRILRELRVYLTP